MSRMLDLIRASALRSHQMMSAAKGALQVPPAEMVEILVYIAEHNKIYREQARLTLAGWDEATCKQIASEPGTPREVLEYWLSPNNIRPALFGILLENPSVSISKIALLGTTLKGELVDVMIASPRVRGSIQVLNDLSTNHELSGAQAARVQALIKGTGSPDTVPEHSGQTGNEKVQPVTAASHSEASVGGSLTTSKDDPSLPADPEADIAVSAFIAEHAAEIAAEGDKPFQPLGGIYDEAAVAEQPPAAAEADSLAAVAVVSTSPTSAAGAAAKPALAAKPAAHKAHVNPADEQRGSVLQKISKLDIKGRIQLAMKGNKEERSILVRDGTKIVALAVLDSPKITDGEVEKFASQKNVLESLLRAIPMKRRFAKNYSVVRNLVFNPRTPLDVALGLMKNLLVADLRNLSGNKEVSETIRKLALRQFKQKSEASSK